MWRMCVCVGRHLTEERLEDTVGDEGVVAVAAGRPLIHLSVLRREHARVGGRGEHARVGGRGGGLVCLADRVDAYSGAALSTPCMPRSQRPPSRRHGVRLVGVRGMGGGTELLSASKPRDTGRHVEIRSCCRHLREAVRALTQRAQHEHDGEEELVLADCDAQPRRARREQVEP